MKSCYIVSLAMAFAMLMPVGCDRPPTNKAPVDSPDPSAASEDSNDESNLSDLSTDEPSSDEAVDDPTPAEQPNGAAPADETRADEQTSVSAGDEAAENSQNSAGANVTLPPPNLITTGDDPLDWPNWRGPEQNGISRELGLIESWDPKGGEGSNLLWKKPELGGRSTPIVLRGKLVTIVRADPATEHEGEMVVCVDAKSGEILWENRFNVYLSDVPDTRVGWSSCVGDPETGRVYVQGVSGYFACLDGDSGETVWSRSLHEEYGFLSTYGGRTNVPVLFEDLVITSAVVIGWDEMAKPAHRFMAFKKESGELVWFNGTRLIPYDTTYSTPTVTVLDGQAAMVFGSGDGQVWAIQPRTGQHIWHYEFSRRGVNVSPLVVGNMVYAGHSEENLDNVTMGSLVALDGAARGDLSGQEKWRLKEMMVGKSSPIMVNGRLYAIDDRAKLFTFDPETGEQLDRQPLGTVQRSSPLYADGKIYTCTNNGRWYILRPTDRGVEVIHKLRLSGDASDGSPIVSHGRIYLPMSEALYCLGREEHEPTALPLPEGPKEKPSEDDAKPAFVQVVPCEVLLSPGDKQQFTARLFNARGQLLEEKADAEFTVDGPGEITTNGEYAASATGHVAAFIRAKVGEVEGQARIRIVPPLPWSWDFAELDDVPITWIGGRVRHEVREVDGDRVMVKRDNIPTKPGHFTKLGTRSQLWMGPIDLANYTITADIQGQTKEGKMPDVGLINSRYTLTLQGESQDLRIYSWQTHDLRTQAAIPFEWKPEVWYTMKFRTEIVDGKANVRGKVWPRGEPEPEAWTIELVDEEPNTEGAPGTFGNAKDAEIYLDNISVTPNEA